MISFYFRSGIILFKLTADIEPFPTYNKSSADDFENNWTKRWKISVIKLLHLTCIIKYNYVTTNFPLTLSLIQTLSDASAADGLLKTQLQKKKLLKTSNFFFCHNVFHFQSQVIHSIIEIFYFLTNCVQIRLLQYCPMRERVNIL